MIPRHPTAVETGRGAARGLRWEYMIHVVRDLAASVPSVAVENHHARKSFAYRRKHILAACGVDLAAAGSRLEQAIWSIVYWNKVIRSQGPEHVFRVEDGIGDLEAFLVGAGLIAPVRQLPELPPSNVAKRYTNGLWGRRPPRPVFGPDDWATLTPECRSLVTEFCESYGYASPLAGAVS